MNCKREIIDVKDLESFSPLFRGAYGQRFAEWFIKITALDKVNWLYDHSINCHGPEFAAGCLKDLGVNYEIGNSERLKMLPEGAFITVSNHPYGALDGIIIIDLMATIRPDYKFMVNRMISRVKTMKENFISVIPADNARSPEDGTNSGHIRETLKHLHEGHPVGFFPSGAVSDFSLKEMRIRDRPWQPGILHLIRNMKVPIVPVRFFDTNSLFFYFLGIINWKIRLLRVPAELFNKRGKKIRVGIGNIISVDEQKEFADVMSLGAFLRQSVYEMAEPQSFVSRSNL